MSIASLCTGSTFLKQVATNTPGAMGGNAQTWTDVSTIDCRVEHLSISESLAYDARGQKRFYRVYFSSDPSLTNNHRGKVTKIDQQTISPARYLRFHAYETEGSPDGSLALWIAVCEDETTRFES